MSQNRNRRRPGQGRRFHAGRRPARRRGVLLLVVLSILVLFAVISVAFALVSSQFRRSSIVQPRLDQYAVDFKDQLDDALKQVLRGTNNPLSVISIHSLLEDMYGFDSFTNTDAKVSIVGANITQNSSSQAVGQLIDIQLSAAIPAPMPVATLYSSGAPSGYYNGCVLTMLSGPLAGKSTRIVGYDSGTGPGTSGTPTLRVVTFEGSNAAVLPAANQSFLINGRPFNGTGFGFNPTTGLVNAGDNPSSPNSQHLFALLPNPKYFNSAANPNYTVAGGIGGADEDYDAADWNNMLLGLTGSPMGNGPYPSLHRPDLIQYWVSKTGASGWKDTSNNFQPLLRQAMLRPIGGFTGSDHPNFTGSNLLFDPINGPWDVDTDGDGVNDSVWVDLGFPVQTAADGTTYKPLFAIRCLDLDNRLNVNAHGDSAQTENAYLQNLLGAFAGPNGPVNSIASSATTVSAGSGYGPAEINLSGLFAQTTSYPYLFSGDPNQGLEGRYGEYSLVNQLPYPGNPPGSMPPGAGITAGTNPLSIVKHFEFPVAGSPTLASAYGSPADLWGRGFLVLDVQGTPLTPGMSGQIYTGASANVIDPTQPPAGVAGKYDTLNNPYALNLSRSQIRGALRQNANDNPYSVAELERILRAFDLDASSLPSRLASILDPTVSPGSPLGTRLSALRNEVSTDSFDLPSPNILLPKEIRTNGTILLAYGASDLLAARLNAKGVTGNALLTNLQTMLPPDLMNGLRFDINRPFGNGVDDNQDGVVDDYAEYSMGEPAWGNAFPGGATVNLAIDYNNDGSINYKDALLARHLMARYLYVMAMMLVDSSGSNGQAILNPANQSTAIVYDAGAAATTPNPYQVQYALAQWAINCVDFRDRDSIMTPFEFDVNPFNGWAPDGDITTPTDYDQGVGYQTVVWGTERPELLITETTGLHDRRTEDLGVDTTPVGPAGNKTTGDPMTPDSDFDQRLLPQASCFIELYNPWHTHASTLNSGGSSPLVNTPSSAEVPGELYYDANNNNYKPYSGGNPSPPVGVLLNKRDPLGNTPVWRLIFVNNNAGKSPDPRILDPDDPIVGNRPASSDIDRSVYFVQPPNGFGAPSGSLMYYSSQPVSPLKPGRYAVVGSTTQKVSSTIAGVNPANAGSVYMTKIGRTKNATDTSPDTTNTRRIVLGPDPNGSPDVNQVWVMKSGQSPADPTPLSGAGANNVQPAIAVALDSAVDSSGAAQTRSFAISDPIAGYTPGAAIAGNNEGETSYGTPLDKPQDSLGDSKMLVDTTYPNYRTVHLQRLANPQTPWNPPPNTAGYNANYPVNPYITIDSASVDVTAFNGANNTATLKGTSKPKDATQQTGTQYQLVTTQRGDQLTGSKPPQFFNNSNLLWAHEYAHVPNSGRLVAPGNDGDGTHLFNFQLHHSLGFLSQAYGAGFGTANYYTSGTAPAPVYVGALVSNPQNSQSPFPWLTWNNRPYVSQTELALVPKSRASRLLFDYSVASGTGAQIYTAQAGSSITYPGTPGGGGAYATYPNAGAAPQLFGHLLNFFDAGSTFPANLYRIFEYVHVPSRYVGTETVLSPQNFASATKYESAFWSYLRPPFNKVSEYRDPGRININTLVDGTVVQGLFNNYNAAKAQVAADIVNSRQGLPGLPSLFANPFRSFGGAALTSSIYNDPSVSSTPVTIRDIDVTFLRPSTVNANVALFDNPNAASPTPPTNPPPYGDFVRSPYFRLQNAGRVSNLLTTRSNVYAVWATVGYFQVTPWTGGNPPGTATVFDTAHPDGLQLGQELGSDTGDIKRHRAFYIFDRTIPVGFQRGEDNNVENAILLKRFIE